MFWAWGLWVSGAVSSKPYALNVFQGQESSLEFQGGSKPRRVLLFLKLRPEGVSLVWGVYGLLSGKDRLT